MNEIITTGKGSLSTFTGGLSTLTQDVLNAIPLALAAPILSYQKTRTQAKLIEIAIEAKKQERAEILRTMQVLAKHGQLTNELAQQLMIAYNSQPY